MNNDIAAALSNLRLDPQDLGFLEVLTSLSPAKLSEEAKTAIRRLLATERSFHLENENVSLAMRILEKEIAFEEDPKAQANLLYEKARLQRSGELKLQSALMTVNEALTQVPDHAGAVALLRELEEEAAHWKAQLTALNAPAEDTQDQAAAATALASQGEIFLRHGEMDEKAEAVLRQSLELDPQNKRADFLLEHLYLESQRYGELELHYSRRIEAALGPVERSHALVALGRCAQRLNKRDEALTHFRLALSVHPGNESALFAVGKLLSKPEEEEDLVNLYEVALKASKRGSAEAIVALVLGEFFWKRKGKLEVAEPYFRRVRKALPHHPKAIAFYRDYHLSRDELPQVLTLLLQAQKAEQDTERRIQYGMDLAELAERKPQFLEKAIDAWKSLLRIRPGMPEAVAALRRLFTKTEKWNALLELLKDQCEALPTSEVEQRVERYLEMVPIYRDKLKLEVMVINTYATILSIQPDHAVAMNALAELYEAQGRWGDLAGVRVRQAQAATDPVQKAALYHRVAALWVEKFGNHHNAISALEKVIEVAPNDEKARQMLREIYTRGRSWRALLELYRRELPVLAPEIRKEHLVQMAVLASEKLADSRQAISLWNEVLGTDPFHPTAIPALAMLYEREKRWPALAEILERQAALAGCEKTPQGCALLERRGILLLEKLGAGHAAMMDLRRVHSAQPEHPRVLRALREAYAQSGDLDALESLYSVRNAWDEVCDVLAALADRTADMRLRTRALERVALIAKERLHQPERVLKAYEGILATMPDRREIARAAAEIYKQTERYGRYVATLELVLGPETEPALSVEESLPILKEAREVCEKKMDAKGLAFKWCARAYRLAPTNPQVYEELVRLAKVADEWEFLLALLIERQGMAGPSGPSPEERLTILRACLELVTTRLDRPVDVQRFAETILSEVPGDTEAEAALITLYSTQDRWSELVALQHSRVNRMNDPMLQAEALVRVARIEEEKLTNRLAAIRSLQLALKAEPHNVRVLRELSRLLQAEGDFRSLTAVLTSLIEQVDDADRADVVIRLGQVYERELGDYAAATQSYLQGLELDSIHAEAVRGLERMLSGDVIRKEDRALVARRLAPYYELTENYIQWASTLESLFGVAETEEEKKSILDILGDLYAGPLGDTLSAYGAMLRLFELDPRRSTVRDRLVQLGELVGKLPEIATVTKRLLEAFDGLSLRLDLLILLAEVEERQPSRLSEAEAALRQVLQLEPLHLGAYKTLCRFCKEAERWGALRDLVMAREQHLPDMRQRLDLLWQVIEIDEGLLYDRAHASTILQRIIEMVPDDLRAYRILERYHAESQKWRELDNLLASEVRLVGKTEVADLKLRRADLALTQFHEPVVALHFIVEVLDLVPNHAQLIPLLERCLALPEVRQRAATLLEPLLAANSQWARLTEILDIEAESEEGAAQVALLSRKAELKETRLSEPGQAFDTWRVVLEKDPSSTRALWEAERLGGALGRYSELIAIYEGLVVKRDASDLAGISDLLTRAARLWMAHEPDRKASIKAWRRVLDLDPSSPEMGGDAATALEALYAEMGDYEGLIFVLHCRAEWTGDTTLRGTLLLRVADLEGNFLHDTTKATATYRSLLESESAIAQKAFEQLDRIYQQTSQPKERALLLKRRVDGVDADERRTLRFKIANIAEVELHDPDDAIATLRAVLDDSPTDREALLTLVRLYELQEASAERLEILERLLNLAQTDNEQIALLGSIAQLLAGPLGQTAKALERWREILHLSPSNHKALQEVERLLQSDDSSLRLAAAKTLEPLFVSTGEVKKLAGILSIYIELAEDAHSRSLLRARLADIEEKRLGNRVAAFKTWAAAIREDTSDPGLDKLLDSYERLATSLGPDTVLDILELYREIEPDILADTTRMRVQQSVANHAIALGDLGVAVDYLQRLVERRPDDDGALLSLEKIYRQQEAWKPLYEILLRRAELATTPKAELPLHREAGVIAEKLGNKEEAIAAWERVFNLKHTDAEAVFALEKIYTELSRWDDLANFIERRLTLGVSPGDAIDLRFRLAEIERTVLHDQHRALEYLAQVLSADPNHPQAIKNLEELLADPEVCVEAANLLEPVYVGRNAWKDLVAIDSLRLKFSEDSELHTHWTQRIAQIYEEQIEDLDEAFNWYGRVFQGKPTDASAQEPLLRLAPKQGRWRDFGRLIDEFLENELSNTDEVLALVRMAIRIYDQELNDREIARRHYHRYVEAQLGDRDASALYEDALERWEAWRELRDHLDDQARLVDSQDLRADLLRRSALLSDERLSEPSAAIVAIRTVLEIHPDDMEAAVFLDQLLTQEGRFDDLRDHLVWMLSRTDQTTAKDALMLELAKVEAEHLSNVTGAVDYFGEILSRTPNHAEAIAALETILLEPDHRARAAELLEPAYRTIRDLRKLADCLKIRLETILDGDRRIAAWKEIASIEAHLEHPSEALEARGNAWLEDVTNTETLVELESQAAQSLSFERLVEWLEKGAELAMDPELCGDLHAFRANILEARLANPEAAMSAWREALEARPDHQDSFLALERLLADAGKIADLCEVLEKHSEVAMEPQERLVLVKRVATLYEYPLAQLPKAIPAWRSVLDIDQADSEALDALIRLYQSIGDETNLVEILLRKIETCRDPSVVRTLRFQTAEVYDQKLQDPVESAGQLRAVLTENPDDTYALEMLGSLCLREKQYVEFVEVLDQRARLAPHPQERWNLAFQAASVTQNSLYDLISAVERYQRILDENPGHPESREALWTLARGEDQRVMAMDVLEPVLRASKEWNALCEILDLRLTTVDLPNDRVAYLTDKAKVQEFELGDRPGAFLTYARALAEDPVNEVIREAIERLAIATGNVPGLALVYEERMKESFDVSLQLYFTSRLATLCEGVLGQPGRAVELWSAVASLPGAEAEALRHLESLLRFLGRNSELADVLQREAEAATTPLEQAEFWTQLGLVLLGPGDISFSPIEDPGRAIEAFRSALDRNPRQEKALLALRTMVKHKKPPLEALDILIPLAEEHGDFSELASLLEIRVNQVDDPNEQASLYLRIADIQETRLASPVRAMDALVQALTVDPGAETIADRVERLATAIGKPVEAARRLAEVLPGIDPMFFPSLALRAARLYLTSMTPANEQLAQEFYNKVLAIEPENTTALESLEVIYRHLKDSTRLAEILERRGALELNLSQRMAFYAEAARSHELTGNLPAAIAAWRSAKEGNESAPEPLDELARLMEVIGDHAELVETLREKSQHLDDHVARADLLVRVAELQAGPLEDKNAAVETLKEALDFSPAHPLALAVLVEIEELRGDFIALEEALLRQSASLSGEELYTVLAKLAQNAQEHMHDSERALVYLQQILSGSGDNRYAFAESERLLTDLMRWHELIDLLERFAEVEARVGNTAGELSCRVKIASLWGEKLGAEENALLALEEVLKRDPNHCPSLLAVARIHQAAERWEDATAALEKAAAVATTRGEKADLYYRRAKIAEAIGEPVDQVAPLYQAAMAQDPTWEPALTAFEAIARKQNDPRWLAQALTQRIDQEKDETRLKACLAELAELNLGPLATPAEAIAPLERLLKLKPDDTGIQEKLAGAFIETGRVDEGEYAMEVLINRLTKDRRMKEVARLKCQLGSFAEARGDLRLAQQRYAAAFQIDPTQSVVLGSLARLALRQNDPESSRRYLRTLLLQNFDEKAAGITKAEVFLELGRLHLLSGEKGKARNMFERGLETDPKNEELKKALAETPR